jgi:CBS domain-containing protein
MSYLVDAFMTSKVQKVSPDTSLNQAYRILREHSFSSVPVVEGERPVGILSRSDLVRLGQPEQRSSLRGPLLTLPDRKVGEVMQKHPVSVTSQTPVAAAAALMVARRIHRVLVTHKDTLTGVFSTRDVMDALQAARSRAPISDYMSTPVLDVPTTATVKQATERLSESGVSGLVVVEDELPVGFFTQVEALQSAAEPGSTPVEDAMNYALLCLDLKTPLHRAAAQARATRARRILAVEHRRVWGILTGLDFARAATSLP